MINSSEAVHNRYVPIDALICLANEDVEEEGDFRAWVQTGSLATDSHFEGIVTF